MSKFTLLEKELIFGPKKLDIFNKCGTKCAPTDFAVLLGCDNDSAYKTEDDLNCCSWWTKTGALEGSVCTVFEDGTIDTNCVKERVIGYRVAAEYDSLTKQNHIKNDNDSFEIEFGEYPQTIVESHLSNLLEIGFRMKIITKTNKKYTTDKFFWYLHDQTFMPREFDEYYFNNNKYIRFVADDNSINGFLKDQTKATINEVYWIKVEPIKWLIDKKSGLVISKNVLFSGIQFDENINYQDDYSFANINKFLETYFEEDIIPSEKSNKEDIHYDELDKDNKSTKPKMNISIKTIKKAKRIRTRK